METHFQYLSVNVYLGHTYTCSDEKQCLIGVRVGFGEEIFPNRNPPSKVMVSSLIYLWGKLVSQIGFGKTRLYLFLK